MDSETILLQYWLSLYVTLFNLGWVSEEGVKDSADQGHKRPFLF